MNDQANRPTFRAVLHSVEDPDTKASNPKDACGSEKAALQLVRYRKPRGSPWYWPVAFDDPDKCWNWTAAVCPFTGYGAVRIRGVKHNTHQYMYRLLRDSYDTDRFCLDHLCRNRRCCNPKHLEVVTYKVNSRRGAPCTKTLCVSGHEFTPTNTYIHPKTGWRSCKLCRRKAFRAHLARKSAAS